MLPLYSCLNIDIIKAVNTRLSLNSEHNVSLSAINPTDVEDLPAVAI